MSRHAVTLRRCSLNVAEEDIQPRFKQWVVFKTPSGDVYVCCFFFLQILPVWSTNLSSIFLVRASPVFSGLKVSAAQCSIMHPNKTNKQRCQCMRNQNHAEPQTHRVQAGAGTLAPAGGATYQGTSLVVTIPCAWRVFGPFCHFAL